MEKILTSKLVKIFGIRKVTLSAPGDDKEQDVLFVSLERNKSNISKGRISFRMEGVLSVFSQNEKLPMGFFHKKIDQARASDKKEFFFHSFDENNQYGIQNLCERKVSFTFVSSAQYDPDKGQITQLEVEC